MSIDDLTAIVSPPESPSEVPAKPNWKTIQTKLKLSLPEDYKRYVLTYGSGLLANFVIVANPFSAKDGVSLLSVVDLFCDTLRELRKAEGAQGVPYDIFPGSPGLLPWGGDENGNGLYWLTDGVPNEWPCVVGAGRDARWQKFDMPMTEFLAKSIRGDIKCKIWPAKFAKPSRFVFKPY